MNLNPPPSPNLPPGVSKNQAEEESAGTFSTVQSSSFNRHAFRAGLIYLISASVAFLSEVYLARQSQAWQAIAMAGIGGILVAVAVISIYLTRKDRAAQGIKLLIISSLISVLLTPLLIAGFGLLLGLGTVLVVLIIALQTLPRKEANRAILLSIIVAILAGLLDYFGGLDYWLPGTQLTLPFFQNVISILGGAIIIAYLGLAIPQYHSYALSTKLILAFLVVSLIPLGVLAFLNNRHTLSVLTTEARQSLLAAVSQTSSVLNNFININLNSVRTESQLPPLVNYLKLPPEERLNSPQEIAAQATLDELSRKDKVFIMSYGLLDSQGRNLLDTRPSYIGQDEAGRGYVDRSLETGLSYVSPIQFIPGLDETDQETAALFFVHPIYNQTGDLLGFLRVQFHTNILQHLVVQENGLLGKDSFAILFDENHLRLAHGTDPGLNFTFATSPSTERFRALKTDQRIPISQDSTINTDIPSLTTGLDNAIFEPFFTTQLATTGERFYLAAVKQLDALPWLVVFVQAQDAFLSPIQAQTRFTLFLAITIAGVVAAAAFIMGQILANPLVNLTEIVTRFTAGDLDVRAQFHATDESGVLAASFNTMAEQVGSLLRRLAERTQELETEILERERAEINLKTSEERYRDLFQSSHDPIFITHPTGDIIDINRAGERLTGYTREALGKMNVQDLFVDLNRLYALQEAVQRQGSIRDFEVKLKQKGGAEIDCLITGTLRLASDGSMLGYQGVIRDITEQKHAESERLRLTALQRELAIANEIQTSLMPPATPNWPELEVLCYTTTAREVGGDFYTYHAFEPSSTQKRFAVVVGDVTGKGISAALLMSVSLASFQSSIAQGHGPVDLLTSLDQVITQYTGNTNQNCALIYSELVGPRTTQTNGANPIWTLRVANAGCMIPLIRRVNGQVEWIEAFGLPLGTPLSSTFDYQEVTKTLSAGDIIILSSDGVVEATNQQNEMLGFERLAQAVETCPQHQADAMLTHLQATLTAFIGDSELHDDMTIAIVKV